jgi:hypothetical protein
MSNIVLIQDLIDSRKRKQEELSRYTKNLESLKVKLDYLRKEIALTERIISMVKKEEILDLTKL